MGQVVEAFDARRPEATQLSGRYVKLERLSVEAHGEDLWQVLGGMQNAALWRYMGEGPLRIGMHSMIPCGRLRRQTIRFSLPLWMD